MTIVFIAADPMDTSANSIDIRFAYAITGRADHYFIYGSVQQIPWQHKQESREHYMDYLFGAIVDKVNNFYHAHHALPSDLRLTCQTSDFDSAAITPLHWQGYRLELPD